MSKYNYINSYSVGSLSEFHSRVQMINRFCGTIPVSKQKSQKPLWFRGHERADYMLLPSLFRNYEMNENTSGRYGAMRLREEYRLHRFQQQAYHQVHTHPGNRIDWQEIMQHHLMKTRLMDWSEIAHHALAFALEPYLHPDDDLDKQMRRRMLDPVVWILDPLRLNEHVYDALIKKDQNGNYSLIENVLDDDVLAGYNKKQAADELGNELCKKSAKKWYLIPDQENMPLRNGINISSIDSYRRIVGGDLARMLRNYEFNPFFYLLARYYVDGVSIDLSSGLPPLATLHPYHSDRVLAQRGAFAIYPYYKLSWYDEQRKKQILDPRCMEDQPCLTNCLFEIRILRPAYVARELLNNGIRRSYLYPDMENIAKDLEAPSYYI